MTSTCVLCQAFGTGEALQCSNFVYRFDAIRKTREWAASLPPQTIINKALKVPLSPRYSIDDLLSIVNPDVRKPFDMAEVVLRLVDDSRVAPFKPSYGKNLLTSWAEIHGERPPWGRKFVARGIFSDHKSQAIQ